jgi:hypothetical protein
MYLLQLPPAAPKGKLLKQRVVGLVGAECGWECSPITLVAVTTSYLVHGKKAKLLSVYLTLEAGGLPGEKVCAILGGHMVGKENEYRSARSTAGYLR